MKPGTVLKSIIVTILWSLQWHCHWQDALQPVRSIPAQDNPADMAIDTSESIVFLPPLPSLKDEFCTQLLSIQCASLKWNLLLYLSVIAKILFLCLNSEETLGCEYLSFTLHKEILHCGKSSPLDKVFSKIQ